MRGRMCHASSGPRDAALENGLDDVRIAGLQEVCDW